MSFSQELQFWNQALHTSSSATTILERSDVLWMKNDTTSKLIFKNVTPSIRTQYRLFSLAPTNFIPHPHTSISKNIQPIQSYVKKQILDSNDVDFIIFQILLLTQELEQYHLSLSFPLSPLVVIAPNQKQLSQKFQLIPSFQTRRNIIDVVKACVELIEDLEQPIADTKIILDWLEDPPPSLCIGIEILKNHIQNSWNLKYIELKNKYHLLQQYYNAQKNNQESSLLLQDIDVPSIDRFITNTGSSIKLLDKSAQTTIIELSTTTFNNQTARRFRKELISILHCEIQESTKKQIQNILEWINKRIQKQRQQKILQTQLRQSQN